MTRSDRSRMLVAKYNKIVFPTEEDAKRYYNERVTTRRSRKGNEVLEGSQEFVFDEHGATGVIPVGVPMKYRPLYVNSYSPRCEFDEEYVPPYRKNDGTYVHGFCRKRKE